MSLHLPEKPKFNYGDTLIIKKNVLSCLHPGEIVSVCSITKINPEDVKNNSSLVEPSWLYTVEFGDGNSIELPECFLEKYT